MLFFCLKSICVLCGVQFPPFTITICCGTTPTAQVPTPNGAKKADYGDVVLGGIFSEAKRLKTFLTVRFRIKFRRTTLINLITNYINYVIHANYFTVNCINRKIPRYLWKHQQYISTWRLLPWI